MAGDRVGWAANYQLLLRGREERGERGEVGFDGTGQVRLKGQQPGSETN